MRRKGSKGKGEGEGERYRNRKIKKDREDGEEGKVQRGEI